MLHLDSKKAPAVINSWSAPLSGSFLFLQFPLCKSWMTHSGRLVDGFTSGAILQIDIGQSIIAMASNLFDECFSFSSSQNLLSKKKMVHEFTYENSSPNSGFVRSQQAKKLLHLVVGFFNPVSEWLRPVSIVATTNWTRFMVAVWLQSKWL